MKKIEETTILKNQFGFMLGILTMKLMFYVQKLIFFFFKLINFYRFRSLIQEGLQEDIIASLKKKTILNDVCKQQPNHGKRPSSRPPKKVSLSI